MIKASVVLSVFVCTAVLAQAQDVLDQEAYNRATAWYNEATSHYDFGEIDSALEKFSQAIALNPNNSDYFFGRASCYNELGQLSKAAEDMTMAISMEPDQPDYHYFGANIFFKSKDYEAAVANYTKAIANQGNSDVHINLVNCYYNRGVSYLLIQLYEEAAEDFSKVIEMDPSFAQAFHNRGVALKGAGHLEAGCRDFRKARQMGVKKSQEYIDTYCEL